MSNYKQITDTKLASLPIFNNTDLSNVKLNPLEWRGESDQHFIFNKL